MAKARMEATTAHHTTTSSPGTSQRPDDPPLEPIARGQVAAGALRAERRRARQQLETLAARVSALRASRRGRGR